MMFTNLIMVKKGTNEFFIEVAVYSQFAGALICKRKWSTFVTSIEDAQSVLSTFPNRDCQRTATSTSATHRFRATRSGDLCLTCRWDGDTMRFPQNGFFSNHVVIGSKTAETVYPGYVHIDRISSFQWRELQYARAPTPFFGVDPSNSGVGSSGNAEPAGNAEGDS